MKRRYLLLVFLCVFSCLLHAQMKEPYEWIGYENVMGEKMVYGITIMISKLFIQVLQLMYSGQEKK